MGVVVVGQAEVGDEERVDERHRGQCSGRAVLVVLGDGTGVGHEPGAEQADGGEVGVVVLPAHAGHGEEVPQGGPVEAGGPLGVLVCLLGREVVVGDPVGLGRVHVVPVGVGVAHPAAVVAIEGGEVLHDLGDHGQVDVGVVAEGVLVGARAGLGPAVGDAVAIVVEDLEPAAVVAVAGVVEACAAVVGDAAGPPVRGLDPAAPAAVGAERRAGVEPDVLALAPPAQVVVGRAVLHHHHDHVADVGVTSSPPSSDDVGLVRFREGMAACAGPPMAAAPAPASAAFRNERRSIGTW